MGYLEWRQHARHRCAQCKQTSSCIKRALRDTETHHCHQQSSRFDLDWVALFRQRRLAPSNGSKVSSVGSDEMRKLQRTEISVGFARQENSEQQVVGWAEDYTWRWPIETEVRVLFGARQLGCCDLLRPHEKEWHFNSSLLQLSHHHEMDLQGISGYNNSSGKDWPLIIEVK